MKTPNTLTHLRNRTEHSYRTATGKIAQVLAQQRAERAGICDRHGTWGHVRFAAACKDAKHKPMFGVELACVPDMEIREKQAAHYISFLARTDAGLRQIYELVTLATEKFYYIPRIEFSLLNDLCKGGDLIALAGYHESIPKKLKNFYWELNQTQRYAPDNYPAVATQDNLYPTPADRATYEIILGDNKDSRTTPAHILDYWQWVSECGENKKAIDLAQKLAGECNAKLPVAEMVKPKVNYTLRDLCLRGAKALKIDLKNDKYKARLNRELTLIAEKKFEDYFFVVADMVAYAKSVMYVGPARGSSCGSLVCYLTGITDIDPLPYDLLFERFIDINREDYPDIDIDFEDVKRDMVFDYLRKKYGYENVCRLGTINVFKAKSAVTDTAKQLRIPAWEIENLKSSIIERSSGDARAENCIMDTFQDLEIGRQTLEKYPELRYAADIEGHARHTGVHAAAIIVTAKPVTNFCAVNTQTGAAMLDKKDAEKINLLKIDALGLRTLSVMQDTLDQVGWSREHLRDFPRDDKRAFDVLNKAHFAGIFQFEGGALQNIAQQMPIETLEDVSALTALARPGPLDSGGTIEYLSRRTGRKPITYFHPKIKVLTEITYGIIVYQEQVMTIAREIGGLSWEDVSQLRKAMSKSLGKEFFEGYWDKFKVGAAKLGLEEKESRQIWEQINTMGSWAFNRSHAVAYGLLSYWCCVLKAYWPLEFAAACLRNAKDEDQSVRVLRELVKEGFEYKSFDKEKSQLNWTVQDGILIGGLTGIKGVGDKLAANIVEKRKQGKPLTPREEGLLTKGETPWDKAFEGEVLWGHVFANPAQYGIDSKLTQLENTSIAEDNVVVFLAKLKEKDLRDHNELKLLERRGGRKMLGQTLYLNLTLEDDTGIIRAKVSRHNYEEYGLPLVDYGKNGEWYVWKGKIQKGFRIVNISRWKKLTGNEAFKKPEKILKKVLASRQNVADSKRNSGAKRSCKNSKNKTTP